MTDDYIKYLAWKYGESPNEKARISAAILEAVSQIEADNKVLAAEVERIAKRCTCEHGHADEWREWVSEDASVALGRAT